MLGAGANLRVEGLRIKWTAQQKIAASAKYLNDRPIYMRISRGAVAFHLSSHAGDGTPGTAVVIQLDDVEAFQRELAEKDYPFMIPGIEPRGIGRELVVIDPVSNQIRFFQPG